ncbi:MAG TPA: hypothetical protein VH914_17080 [Acidimicrobiia bacterium]|nr:hypothetical protein [Acidimicrobiia bacterium]
MTDLEELFGPLIDESARRREPVEQIEGRAREYRKRDRRRHRVQGFLAGAVVVALVAGAVAFVRGGDDSSVPPAQSSPTTTTGVHIPAGWQTYDYGLARISIPPSWSVTEGCPQAKTLVMIDPETNGLGCGAGARGPSVTILPLPSNAHAQLNGTVNGIRYAEWSPNCPPQAHCGAIVDVPRLKVRIDLGNVATPPILQTLTYSTDARVLQQPFGPAPRSWRTITYAGISVRVPKSWKTVTPDACGPLPNTVALGTADVSIGEGACLVRKPTAPPVASLLMTTFDQNLEVTRRLAASALHHNGLTLERAPVTGPFVPAVSYLIARGSKVVDVRIGLGLDPAIARGIAGSIRSAK